MTVVKLFALCRGIDAEDFLDCLSRKMTHATTAMTSPVMVPFFGLEKSQDMPGYRGLTLFWWKLRKARYDVCELRNCIFPSNSHESRRCEVRVGFQ
jgi:hypothetical protein